MNQKVELLDWYGDDKRVADSARVSFNTASKVKELDEKDKTLIDYLIRNEHMTPVEMGQLRYRISCPIYIARQFMRHRAFSYNERSLRYIDFPEDEMFIPTVFRSQSANKKQGSDGPVEDQLEVAEVYIDAVNHSIEEYQKLLKLGVCKEQARGLLPLASMTQFIVEGDLRNWFNFFKLRLDSHAQQEIRDLAQMMYDLAKPHFPVSFEAFEEHILNSKTFSAKEYDVIDDLINQFTREQFDAIVSSKLNDRDKRIFFEKLGIER